MMSAQLRDPPHHRGGKAIPPSPVSTFCAHHTLPAHPAQMGPPVVTADPLDTS